MIAISPRPPLVHADGLARCPWAGADPLYLAYHDTEWGVPEWNSRALFEKLLLDGFQAGLSWITILRKRDAFRIAFDGFEPEIMASYTSHKVETLLQNPGIIRHRGKIEAAVTNAQAYLRLQEHVDFSSYLWNFMDGAPLVSHFSDAREIPAQTPLSQKIAKDLRQKGFSFVGPTIIYAFMQAVGMVDDHLVGCHCRSRRNAL